MASKKTPVRKAPVAPSAVKPTAKPNPAAMAIANAKGPHAVLSAIQAGRKPPSAMTRAAQPGQEAPKASPVGRMPGRAAQQAAPKGPTVERATVEAEFRKLRDELKASESARAAIEKEADKLRAQIASLTEATVAHRMLASVVDPEAQAPMSPLTDESVNDWGDPWIGTLVSFSYGQLGRSGKIESNGTVGRGIVCRPHPERDSGKGGHKAEDAQQARDLGWLAIWPVSQIKQNEEGASVTGAPLYYSQEDWAVVIHADPSPAYVSDVAPELLG